MAEKESVAKGAARKGDGPSLSEQFSALWKAYEKNCAGLDDLGNFMRLHHMAIWKALGVAEEAPVSESAGRLAPPSPDEIGAYRDLFRAELDKRMDTKHPSASPSTEAHAVALRRFVEARNGR